MTSTVDCIRALPRTIRVHTDVSRSTCPAVPLGVEHQRADRAVAQGPAVPASASAVGPLAAEAV